ncbi:TPA: hypothetical protein DF272_03320 [Candidatus Falkowbacteria bacterium]|nr:hypothetical protein [Candidatus Falkowbacteria bacterium]
MDYSNDYSNWEKFWQSHDAGNEPKTFIDNWSNLSWQVGLEFWREVFDRKAHGKTILECGAGEGRTSLYLAGFGYQPTLIDNSQASLDLAQKHFSNHGLSAKYSLADVQSMPFPDNHFDVIYSGGLLHHFDQPLIPLTEMYRVLKPGGILAATIIPRKFSCQTIGDGQRFIANVCYKTFKGEFKHLIKNSRKNWPFYVNRLSLKEYIDLWQDLHLTVEFAGGFCPFPSFALPPTWQRQYTKFLKNHLENWKQFNLSQTRWAELWGVGYNIYGRK